MSVLNCDLSFDPADPYFPLPGSAGLTFAVQVFTTVNGYGLDPLRTTQSPDGSLVSRGLARLGQQATAGDADVSVRVTPDSTGWSFDISGSLAEPVKSVKLIVRGVREADLDAGWWSASSPAGQVERGTLQWNYPGMDWATPWAAAGEFSAGFRNREVSGSVLHVGTPAYTGQAEIELVHSVDAASRSTTVTVPTLRVAVGGVAAELEAHRAHVRALFSLPAWEERTDVPEWTRATELVVTLHGQHWTGHVFNTFAQMEALLERVADAADPASILAYLPGWEGRYYYDYPRYRPGTDLGGDEGFGSLAATARRLGIRLMPMFGANGANVVTYPDWERAAIRNDSNRYPTMLNSPDWDGDRHPEGDQVFLNPGEPRYRAHLVESVSRMVTEFGVDAAFFDTAAFWFNDPRYSLFEGYRALVGELRELHPQVLLASEGWWDGMLSLFPVSQQWLGVPREIAVPGIVSDHALTTGHLAEGTPGLGSTGVHEQGYRTRPMDARIPGHLPVVSFAGGSADEGLALVRSLTATVLRG